MRTPVNFAGSSALCTQDPSNQKFVRSTKRSQQFEIVASSSKPENKDMRYNSTDYFNNNFFEKPTLIGDKVLVNISKLEK